MWNSEYCLYEKASHITLHEHHTDPIIEPIVHEHIAAIAEARDVIAHIRLDASSDGKALLGQDLCRRDRRLTRCGAAAGLLPELAARARRASSSSRQSPTGAVYRARNHARPRRSHRPTNQPLRVSRSCEHTSRHSSRRIQSCRCRAECSRPRLQSAASPIAGRRRHSPLRPPPHHHPRSPAPHAAPSSRCSCRASPASFESTSACSAARRTLHTLILQALSSVMSTV